MRDAQPSGALTGAGDAHAGDDSRLVDDQLDALFGPQFARVVEHHFRALAGAGLCSVLASDPAGARGTMRTILGSDGAAEAVFLALRRSLRRERGRACSKTLLRALVSTSISR
ncbi:MAG: hypothetical protein JRN59_00315 [Nitrososphaerota archaeon]|jgi:hypothetical protein|nr:hypothetical protein [Nitrososphaerota archaeon]